MKATQLHTLGLDRRLAYKLKDAHNRDLFAFHWSDADHCWLDECHPRTRRTEPEAIKLLELAEQFGEIVVFQCCCPQCHTPAAQQAAREFYNRTGGVVSHGFWSECMPRVLEAARRETENLRSAELIAA